MEPNNIEKQIREKLNAREIQPSAQAWDRLDAMLSVTEEKKTKPSFGWLYIAASFLVFATVGTFLYNQGNTGNNTNPVVGNDTISNSQDTPSTSIQDKVEEILSPSAASQELAQSGKDTKTTHAATPYQNHTASNQEPAVNQPKLNPVNTTQELIANTPKNEQTATPKTITVHPELLASNETPTVSKVRINANSLLSEAESAQELSFKGKVLRKVSKNYKEVKEAIASRNFDE